MTLDLPASRTIAQHSACTGVVRRAMLICNSEQIRERHVHRATPVTLLVSMLKGLRPQ
jgi:hypothetical protein